MNGVIVKVIGSKLRPLAVAKRAYADERT